MLKTYNLDGKSVLFNFKNTNNILGRIFFLIFPFSEINKSSLINMPCVESKLIYRLSSDIRTTFNHDIKDFIIEMYKFVTLNTNTHICVYN